MPDYGRAITFGYFLWWAEGDNQLPRFAEQVAPAVPARVTAERG